MLAAPAYMEAPFFPAVIVHSTPSSQPGKKLFFRLTAKTTPAKTDQTPARSQVNPKRTKPKQPKAKPKPTKPPPNRRPYGTTPASPHTGGPVFAFIYSHASVHRFLRQLYELFYPCKLGFFVMYSAKKQ